MATKRKPERNEEPIGSPPPPVAFVLGFVLGGFAGTAFLGLELAVLGWMGVGVPDASGLQLALGTYAVIGGLFGAFQATTGLWGGPWAIGWSLLAFGLALGTKFGGSAMVNGIPGVVGVVFGLVVALVAGQVFARVKGLAAMQLGAAATVGIATAVAGALNLHLLASATAFFPLFIDILAVGFAFVAGLGVWAVSIGHRAPAAHLLVANLVAWGLFYPLWPGGHSPPPSTDEAGTPLVIVTVEGLRGDVLEMETIETPNLARILRDGARFPRTQSTAPWAVPALGSLHTGQLPNHHGAAMHDGSANHMGPIGDNVVTLAQVLARDGYLAGAVVGDSFLDPYGLHRGYRWYSDTADRGPLPTWVAALGVSIGRAPWPVRMPAEEVTDRSLAFLEAQTGGKWMLWTHYVDASSPFMSTAEDMESHGNSIRPWPVDEWEASILTLDRELGRLFEAIPEDALVIVVGTHGVELEEARDRFGYVPGAAVEGHSVYQELIGVPFVVRGPGIVTQSHGRVVSPVDVVPTVLEHLDIEEIPRIDGLEITELRGRIFTEVFDFQEKRAVISMSTRWGVEQQAVRIVDDKIMVRADGTTPLMDLALDDREIHPKPTDARNDGLERRLKGALPPIGSGTDHFDRGSLTERLGRWLSSTFNRRGSGAEPAAE